MTPYSRKQNQKKKQQELVEGCTGIAVVKGSNPVQAWIFQVFFSQLQKLRI